MERVLHATRQRMAATFGQKSLPATGVGPQDPTSPPIPRVGLQSLPNETLAQIVMEMATADPHDWKTARNLHAMGGVNKHLRQVATDTPGVREVVSVLQEAGPVAQEIYEDIYPQKGLWDRAKAILQDSGGDAPSELERIEAVAPSVKLLPPTRLVNVAKAAFAVSDPHDQIIAISLLAPNIDIFPAQIKRNIVNQALEHLGSGRLALDTEDGRQSAWAAARIIAKADNFLQSDKQSGERDRLANLMSHEPQVGLLVNRARRNEKSHQSDIEKAIKHLQSEPLDLRTPLSRTAARVVAVLEDDMQPEQRDRLDGILVANTDLRNLVQSHGKAGPRERYESQKKNEDSRPMLASDNTRQRITISDDIRLIVDSERSRARQMLCSQVRPRNTPER
jgi:hypothetical protein